MRIVMLGTRGIPAQYGGFETAVEEVATRLVDGGHQVFVYCRNPGQTVDEYKGVHLVNMPSIRSKSLETLSHTAASVWNVLRVTKPDVALMFNAANTPFVPILRAAGIPTALHLDGLEWRRAKWRGLGAGYYRVMEWAGVRAADRVIADARAIQDYVKTRYRIGSVFIPYGARIIQPSNAHLASLGVEPGRYHLVVARFEPENHVDIIVEGFVRSNARLPLLVVGGSPYSNEYVEKVRRAAEGDERVRLLGAVWDQRLLDELYAMCASYLHGHSVGGTNPSLLRALGAGAPVTAYAVVFNREVTAGHARFFDSPDGVAAAVTADEADPTSAQERAQLGREHVRTEYQWNRVASDYERLCLELAEQRR